MPDPIKIGFIGGGPRARSLWNSIFSSPKMEEYAEPKAIFDINPEFVKDWRYLVQNGHTSLDSFLKDDIDAVVIGTPPSTHAALSIQCLRAGLDVWSEVPMGLTMEELWGIIDAEKSNKGTKGHYSYGENYCYYVQCQFMAMKNKQNAIGDIYYAEGEYTHSVEHYMIDENYNKKVERELDPELFPNTKPTWRANFIPIKYGHACGPCLYVLNRNSKGVIERPIEVTAMGNMKMQKRFNTQNFQIAMIKTSEDTIVKFAIGFVLGAHGRIFTSFWGSRGLFMGGSFQSKDHYYVETPPEKAMYPDRLESKPQILSDEDLIKLGTPHATGGHGGGDVIMFQRWLESLYEKKPLEIDVYRGAEMTAPGILAVEAIETKKVVPIPKFD